MIDDAPTTIVIDDVLHCEDCGFPLEQLAYGPQLRCPLSVCRSRQYTATPVPSTRDISPSSMRFAALGKRLNELARQHNDPSCWPDCQVIAAQAEKTRVARSSGTIGTTQSRWRQPPAVARFRPRSRRSKYSFREHSRSVSTSWSKAISNVSSSPSRSRSRRQQGSSRSTSRRKGSSRSASRRKRRKSSSRSTSRRKRVPKAWRSPRPPSRRARQVISNAIGRAPYQHGHMYIRVATCSPRITRRRTPIDNPQVMAISGPRTRIEEAKTPKQPPTPPPVHLLAQTVAVANQEVRARTSSSALAMTLAAQPPLPRAPISPRFLRQLQPHLAETLFGDPEP